MNAVCCVFAAEITILKKSNTRRDIGGVFFLCPSCSVERKHLQIDGSLVHSLGFNAERVEGSCFVRLVQFSIVLIDFSFVERGETDPSLCKSFRCGFTGRYQG